jgi:hypothetical protein
MQLTNRMDEKCFDFYSYMRSQRLPEPDWKCPICRYVSMAQSQLKVHSEGKMFMSRSSPSLFAPALSLDARSDPSSS